MRNIPYSRQSINQDDIDAVVEVLRSDWLTQGPKVTEFEEALAHECGAKHCIAVANGTMALHLACLALDVGTGDLGLTSPITFLASANCIAYCGGRVDFADIDLQTLCLSPERVEEYCRTRDVPKVVIPVDFAGVPADLPAFKKLSEKYGFKLIEDAAHSLASTYEHDGRTYACGSCAHTDIAILSFHPVKTITTGEGGAVLTNSDQLADKIRCLSSHGVVRDPSRFVSGSAVISHEVYRGSLQPEAQRSANREAHASNLEPSAPLTSNALPYYHEMQLLGFNARITDIQAALGISQLKRLAGFKSRRQAIVTEYNIAFAPLAEKKIVLLPPWPNGTDPCYHLYPLRLGPACSVSRDDLYTQLREKEIYCQVHYIPVCLQPFYKGMNTPHINHFPEAENYFSNCISLPLYSGLGRETLDFLITTVKSLLH